MGGKEAAKGVPNCPRAVGFAPTGFCPISPPGFLTATGFVFPGMALALAFDPKRFAPRSRCVCDARIWDAGLRI